MAAAGFFIVPSHVLGRGFIAPSDKLNIAAIGAGGKGESDLFEFSKSPNANIAYLCDVDDRQITKSVQRFPKQNDIKIFVRCWIKNIKQLMQFLFLFRIMSCSCSNCCNATRQTCVCAKTINA